MKGGVVLHIQRPVNLKRRQHRQHGEQPHRLQQHQQKQQPVTCAAAAEKTQPLAVGAAIDLLQQAQRMTHRRHCPRETQQRQLGDDAGGKGRFLLAPKIRLLMKNQTAQAHQRRALIQRLQPPHHHNRPQRIAAHRPHREREQNRHAPQRQQRAQQTETIQPRHHKTEIERLLRRAGAHLNRQLAHNRDPPAKNTR